MSLSRLWTAPLDSSIMIMVHRIIVSNIRDRRFVNIPNVVVVHEARGIIQEIIDLLKAW